MPALEMDGELIRIFGARVKTVGAPAGSYTIEYGATPVEATLFSEAGDEAGLCVDKRFDVLAVGARFQNNPQIRAQNVGDFSMITGPVCP